MNLERKIREAQSLKTLQRRGELLEQERIRLAASAARLQQRRAELALVSADLQNEADAGRPDIERMDQVLADLKAVVRESDEGSRRMNSIAAEMNDISLELQKRFRPLGSNDKEPRNGASRASCN